MSRRLVVAVAQSGPIHRADSVIGFNPEWVIDSTGMRTQTNIPRSGAGNPEPAGTGCRRSATSPGSDNRPRVARDTGLSESALSGPLQSGTPGAPRFSLLVTRQSERYD